MAEAEFLTVREAARIIGVAPHTLGRHLRNGVIPYVVDRQRRTRLIFRPDLRTT